MKNLILIWCSVAAFHTTRSEFSKSDVKIDKIQYVETTNKYHLDQNFTEETQLLSEILSKQPLGAVRVTVNDFADKMFANFRTLLVDSGYDPVEMPEVHEGFTYNLIVTYHGELHLVSGLLNDLATLHRGGDVVVSYSSSLKYLVLALPIGFTNLEFNYEYSAQIMGLGPSGTIKGKVKSLVAQVRLGFDVETLELTLHDFEITRAGVMEFTFHGEPLLDWLLDLLAYVVSGPLEDVVVMIAEGVVCGMLEDKLGEINEAIGGLLSVEKLLQSLDLSEPGYSS